jgi:glucose-6-phosphate 1-epimerase
MPTQPDLPVNYALSAGINGLPRLNLTAPDGSTAEIYLHGGHVTSWIPTNKKEQLFLSRTAEFKPGAAIRGGIPVAFPQFATRGSLPKHGFARTQPWQFLEVSASPNATITARLQVNHTPETLALWPHPFTLQLNVTLGGSELSLALHVTNHGDTPFDFTGALHTYLRVADLQHVALGGLQGLRYHDSVGAADFTQTEALLRLPSEVDRVYLSAPAAVELRQPDSAVRITSTGFPHVVVWNPGASSVSIPDLEPDGYRRMVCVEAAAVTPITVQPGQRWSGSQTLHAAA